MSDRKPINISKIPAHVQLPSGVKMRKWMHMLDKVADAAKRKAPDGKFTEANFKYFRSKSLRYFKKHAYLGSTLKDLKTFENFKAFLDRYKVSKRCYDPAYQKAFRKCVESLGDKACMAFSLGDFSKKIEGDRRVYRCAVAKPWRVISLPPPPPSKRPRRLRRPRRLLAQKPKTKNILQIFREYVARLRQRPPVPKLLAKLPPKKKSGMDPEKKRRIDKKVTSLIKTLRSSRDPQKRLGALYGLSRHASHPNVIKLADELLKMSPAAMRKEAEKMYGKVRVWLAIAFYPGLKEQVRSQMIGQVFNTLNGSRNPRAIPITMRYIGKSWAALDTIYNIYRHFEIKGKLHKIKDPDPTPLMQKLLRTRDNRTRRRIVYILEHMQDPKTKNQRIAALRLALDKWSSFRQPAGALDALVRIGDPVALPDIVRLVKNTKKGTNIRASALMAMGAFKHPASKAKRVAFIKPYLKHTNSKMVEAAITALGYARARSAVPQFIAILRDKSKAKYHDAAIRALGFIRDQRAVSVLKRFLGTKLKNDTLWALGKIGGQAAHQAIIDNMLKSPRSRSMVYFVSNEIKALKRNRKDAITALNAAYLVKRGNIEAQEVIIYALGELGARDVLETLTGIAIAKGTWKNLTIQRNVIGALSKAHTDKTLLKLTDVLLNGKKNREQRIRAAKSLKKIGSRRVAPALTKAANHRIVKDVAVRKAALAALCDVNTKWAKGRLYDVIATDPAVSMRALAAEKLGDIDSPKTIKLLVATAQKTSEDMNVRLAAIASLGKLSDRKAIPVLSSLARNGNKKLRLKAIAALGDIRKGIIRSDLHRLGRLPFRLR